MPALLFLIGVVSVFFFATAWVMFRRRPREWARVAVAIPCIILGLLALAVLGGLAWAHYAPPPIEIVLEDFHASAQHRERPEVHAELLARGYKPEIHEETIPSLHAEAYGISAPTAEHSDSYIFVRTGRVRPHDLLAEYVEVVFLFDSQGHLITWSYLVLSPGL